MITSFKIALNALHKNKVRTALTVLGIVIGIAAVIIVMSAGQSVKAFLIEQVETFGSDFIEVEIKVPNTSKNSIDNAMGIAMGVNVTTLKLADAKAIMKLPNVQNSYSGVMGQQIVSYQNQKKQIFLFGTTASFIDIDASEVQQGRFYTEEEDRNLANVAVLGPTVKEKLFGESDALGKLVSIGRQKFKVIGIMKERGGSFGFDMDNMIFLPIRTLQKKVMGIDHISFIFVQVYDNIISEQTADEITTLMRYRHNITDPNKDDFAVTTMAEAMEMLDTILGAITLLLIALAGISLIVGGVGIMNIMYVSVSERTYEIGLRKAVGAKQESILWQFLWEAVVVTFVGAAVGMCFGILIVLTISVVANHLGFSWPFIITIQSIVTAVGFTAAVGLLFGIWPAREAANLDPVAALRR
jgi:putative ABC transport system permease protein